MSEAGHAETEQRAGLLTSTGLPDPMLSAYWRDIVVDEMTKRAVLNYCRLVRAFDSISAWAAWLYRLVLLYGPPGTGKTSLALGVASHLAESDLSRTGKGTRLLQLNVGCLFSEFLGRSVKGVMEGFQAVRIAASQGLVTLVLDEVESLAVERGRLSAGDPSDVMRSVNAFLTELDALRRCKGVLVLATSNIKGTIDQALWDRADMKLYVGRPSREAAQTIVARSAGELAKIGVTFTGRFVDALVNALYDGAGNGQLSGRDLSRLLLMTVCVRGRRRFRVSDAVEVAKFITANEAKVKETTKWKH